MADTGFHACEGEGGRLSSNYTRSDGGGLALVDAAARSRFLAPAVTLSGGGGLVSTALDYLRFARLLRGRGALGEVRLLGRKTVEHMTTNQRHAARSGPDAGRPASPAGSTRAVYALHPPRPGGADILTRHRFGRRRSHRPPPEMEGVAEGETGGPACAFCSSTGTRTPR